MVFWRLIKPIWAKKVLENGKPNEKFKEEIVGKNVIEGKDFSPEFIKEKNDKGYNIYFFPNHPSKDVYSEGVRALSGRLIDVFDYVFVDMDLKDKVYASKEEFIKKLEEFTLPPSRVVDSGHGIHAYWRIRDLTRERYTKLQVRLIQYFKTDPSVFTVLQLMRRPGYFNTKNFDKRVECVSLKQFAGASISATELHEALPPLEKSGYEKVQVHLNRLKGVYDVDLGREDVDIDELPDKFMELLSTNKKVKALFEEPNLGGNRSAADMSLCHLLYSEGFDIREAVAVMKNTQKALEKGASRTEYAVLTAQNTFERRKTKTRTLESVGAYEDRAEEEIREPQVFGPSFLDTDVLMEPWRRNELLGLISGSGVGKTATTLNIFYQTILNNVENDDIFIFFSLEMAKSEIISRWIELVGENSPNSKRLFVVDFLDDQKMPLTIGLQEMYADSREIMQQTGKKISMIAFDHFHEISTHIDENKSPNFSIKSAQGAGFGKVKNLSLDQLAKQLKALVTMLNCFGIVLAQTTKGKGIEDLPLEKDACYGCSQYEWSMNYILTIWQPLYRVHHTTDLRVMAFQYCKIREKRKKDKITVYDPKLLTFNMETGGFGFVTPPDYAKFKELVPLADEARKRGMERKVREYSVSVGR